MKCNFCGGLQKVARVRNGTDIDIVTCPMCIRGIQVLGTHEMLRDKQGAIHQPGEVLDYRAEIAEAFGIPDELLGIPGDGAGDWKVSQD